MRFTGWERLERGTRAVPFPAAGAAPGSVGVQGGRALLAAGTWEWGSPHGQVGESLLTPSVQASGTSSSAGS